MRPPSPSLPDRTFLASALSQGLRLDGRNALEMRKPEFLFGPELGWVECRLGATRVLASIDAKMVKPLPERPFDGLLTVHSEISPMAGPEYEPVRPSEQEVSITRMLDKVLRRSDAVDKESLCIIAGQRVWHIRLTIHCLSDAGNLLDCACLAGIVALKHFRRPEVEVVGDEVTVHLPTERAPMPLSIHHTPFCLTFAFFPPTPPDGASNAPVDSSTIVLLDPNHLESTLATGTMSIALNAQRELCVVQKFGGVPLDAQELIAVVKIATERVKSLNQDVEKALKEDWAGRVVEVR